MKKFMTVGLLMAAGMTMATEVKTAECLTKLDGLFGAKLGAVLEVKEAVNEQGMTFTAYHPQKQFLSFTDYALFVTPTTKKVYRIRAIAQSVPTADSALLKDSVRMIEMRFGGSAVKKDGDHVLEFSNGDFIRVSREKGCVVIDAVNNELLVAAEREVAAERGALMEKGAKFFADDMEALRLILKSRVNGATNETIEICSVLGKELGERLVDTDKAGRLSDGAWCAKLPSGEKHIFEAFGSAMTKHIFRLRAVINKSNENGSFAHLRYAVEKALGVSMEQKKDQNDYCSKQVANSLVTLSWNGKQFVLEFIDANVYSLHEKELKSLPKEFWQGFDAL